MKLEFCDLCKEKTKTTSKMLPIDDKGTQRMFDICDACLAKLSKRVLQAQLEFVNESKWFGDGALEDGDIGTFSGN